MAIPSVRAGQTSGASTSNETTTTATKPTSITAGDMIVLAMVSDAASQTFSITGSLTKLYTDETFQAAGTAVVAYKTAASESDYVATLGTAERQAWIVMSVANPNGIDVSPASGTGNSGTLTFPAMTTTVSNCLGVRIGMSDSNATQLTPFGPLTGWTLVQEIWGTSAGAVGIWTKDLPTAGTEASGTATIAASNEWWAVSFAIAPVAGAKSPVIMPRVNRIWRKYR